MQDAPRHDVLAVMMSVHMRRIGYSVPAWQVMSAVAREFLKLTFAQATTGVGPNLTDRVEHLIRTELSRPNTRMFDVALL